jgi:hypothetical protein
MSWKLRESGYQLMKKITVAVIVAVTAVAGGWTIYGLSTNQLSVIRDPNEPGGQYISAFLATIKNSDEITVTEHSNKWDYLRPDRNQDGYKEKIYQVVQITSSQKESLVDILSALPTRTQDAFPACIFEPHHRIEFRNRGSLIDTMEICFACGQIEWQGSLKTPPWSIYGGMANFVAEIGLHPKADWSSRFESAPSDSPEK